MYMIIPSSWMTWILQKNKNLWVTLQIMFVKLLHILWLSKAKWMELLANKVYYFNILSGLHANLKLILPKKMFHQIQKFPILYLQVNIHTLQKILTCLIKNRDTKNSNIHSWDTRNFSYFVTCYELRRHTWV